MHLFTRRARSISGAKHNDIICTQCHTAVTCWWACKIPCSACIPPPPTPSPSLATASTVAQLASRSSRGQAMPMEDSTWHLAVELTSTGQINFRWHAPHAHWGLRLADHPFAYMSIRLLIMAILKHCQTDNGQLIIRSVSHSSAVSALCLSPAVCG